MNEGALGFSISGAGPSMFAFCNNSLIAENIAVKSKALLESHKMKSKIFVSEINLEGAIRV